MATTFHGSHADPYLDGAHQLADECDPTATTRVEQLRHEEQRTAITHITNLAERALEEEKRIFERDILVEKGGEGAKEDD